MGHWERGITLFDFRENHTSHRRKLRDCIFKWFILAMENLRYVFQHWPWTTGRNVKTTVHTFVASSGRCPLVPKRRKQKFEKSFRENMEKETWRKHLLYKLCGWTEQKCKANNSTDVVSITPQSMFMVAGENSMEQLKRQHQALKTALVVTL